MEQKLIGKGEGTPGLELRVETLKNIGENGRRVLGRFRPSTSQSGFCSEEYLFKAPI
jgi:hypothetical protein